MGKKRSTLGIAILAGFLSFSAIMFLLAASGMVGVLSS
jgi:hypothetical protein